MLKRLDIFPKAFNSELRVKTGIGGALTLISLAYLIYNIYVEIQNFSKISTSKVMSLSNVSLPKRIPIDIDLYVWNDCANLHLDFTNQKRNMLLDVNITHKDFKQIENFCFITASGTIPSVPGSFHIGFGKNHEVSASGPQQHQHMFLTIERTNLSHRIGHIWFGDNIRTPLNRSEMIIQKDNVYMLLYSLQLVPYTYPNGKHGFEVLADFTKVNMERMRTKAIPGIVFEWDFSPLQLTTKTETTPTIHLVSHVLGIFGTFFVFVRWIDRISFKLNNLFRH
jgi:hypothetical protein